MDLSKRVHELEWMDTQIYSLPVMRDTLRFLGVTNRFFGGEQVILRYFKKWSEHWPKGKIIRILDVGTGGAEIPIALVKWARLKHFQLHITAIDLVEKVATVARENSQAFPEISVEQRDLFSFAEQKQSFDYVIASLLLHHIPPNESVRLLKTFDSLASGGFIISDLLRSRPSYWAVKSLSWFIGNEVVRHDGPLSVRRAFHVDELSVLAKDSGLAYLTARREPWFRVSLAGEKGIDE